MNKRPDYDRLSAIRRSPKMIWPTPVHQTVSGGARCRPFCFLQFTELWAQRPLSPFLKHGHVSFIAIPTDHKNETAATVPFITDYNESSFAPPRRHNSNISPVLDLNPDRISAVRPNHGQHTVLLCHLSPMEQYAWSTGRPI